MTDAKFFIAFPGRNGGPDECALMAYVPKRDPYGRRPVFSIELKGRDLARSLDDLTAEYRRRKAEGTLPARNAAPAAKEKRGLSHERPPRPWCTGDLSADIRERNAARDAAVRSEKT